MKQKGFAKVVLVAIAIVVIIAVGYFIFAMKDRPATQQPILTNTNIEDVQILLDKNAWVGVIVSMKGNEFTVPEFNSDDAKKNEESRKIQNAVLSTLTAADFRLATQFDFIVAFAGEISKTGMEKLLKDPRVLDISPNRTSTTQ